MSNLPLVVVGVALCVACAERPEPFAPGSADPLPRFELIPNDISADPDQDGVPNDVDNCGLANPDQADADGDGVGDVCDSSDTDGDGLPDNSDKCPSVSDNAQPDTDADGISNACDGLITVAVSPSFIQVTSGTIVSFTGTAENVGSPTGTFYEWSVTGEPFNPILTTQGAGLRYKFPDPGTFTVSLHVEHLSVAINPGNQGDASATVVVTACPAVLEVIIVITPSTFRVSEHGRDFTVEVLSGGGFDATTVNVASVTLGDEQGTDTPVAQRNGQFLADTRDVDRDGDLDLRLKFDKGALFTNGDIGPGTTQLFLNGERTPCGDIHGSATVTVKS